jgi:hypothetical protein
MSNRLALIAILAGALALPAGASARNHGGGGHSNGRVSHAAGSTTGVSRGPSKGSFYSGNRGTVVHAPRLNPGIVQHHYRTTPRYGVSSQVMQHAPSVYSRQHTSRVYTRSRVTRSGTHYRRHRHRRRGYVYYHGGWWYAFPWWIGDYSDYDYWSDVCASRWGYDTYGYYRCMRYHGFY